MTSKNKKLRYKTKEESPVKVTFENQPVMENKSKIPLSAWFEKKVKTGELRNWQESALEVFMKKQGLTVLEDPDLYELAFTKF